MMAGSTLMIDDEDAVHDLEHDEEPPPDSFVQLAREVRCTWKAFSPMASECCDEASFASRPVRRKLSAVIALVIYPANAAGAAPCR